MGSRSCILLAIIVLAGIRLLYERTSRIYVMGYKSFIDVGRNAPDRSTRDSTESPDDTKNSAFLIDGDGRRADLYLNSVASESRRLSFTIHADDPQLDTLGIGVSADPILRKSHEFLFNHSNHISANSKRTTQLHDRGIISHRGVLNVSTATVLRKRLQLLESDLSKFSQDDMRWCHRYCKNMFFFAPALRAVAHALGSHFLEDLGVNQLFLMNDEISYNVFGEPHFDGWHLDLNAWQSLPNDAWGWTIYVPLDTGSQSAGGGWLRFKDKKTSIEWDEEFQRGDVLIFDRWIWHRLHDFTREREPRLAYLLRVTNDTRGIGLPLSPQYHEPLAKKLRFPVGWQINYYCVPFAHPACRPPMTGSYPEEELHSYRFEIDADGAINDANSYLPDGHARERLVAALNHMGRSSLFDSMPDRRCLESLRSRSASQSGIEDLNSAFDPTIPALDLVRRSACSPWTAVLDAAAKGPSQVRKGMLDISDKSYEQCRNVFVELPPVLPTCISWVHCAIQNELVSDKLDRHRNTGGFPDCLLLLPLLVYLVAREHSLQDMIALDVGANIGSCTMLMLAAGMRVVAFEPVERNRKLLIMTAKQNPHLPRHRLLVLPYGLGDQSVSTFMASQLGNTGNSQAIDSAHMELQSMADDSHKSMIQTNEAFFLRLEDLVSLPPDCADTGAIALMKVDVQGFEYKVFRGAQRLLERGVVRMLVFECEGKRLALHGNVTAQSLYNLVRGLGFVLLSAQHGFVDRDLEGLMLQPCSSEIFGSVNLIALHSKVFDEATRLAIQKCFADYVLANDEYNFSALKTSGSCLDLIGQSHTFI